MALTTRLPSPNIQPFYGFVETTGDALRLIQAARQGIIPRITRRLNDIERRSMVKSGSVFIFSNEESGIKRWTEGLSWSASRIVGNFLVYREVSERGASRHNASGCDRSNLRKRLNMVQLSSAEQAQRKIEKSLVGCLADDHDRFKMNGLIKKTITVKIEGSDHHLIAYYNQDDVRLGKLRPPTFRADIMSLEIPPELLETTKFRVPPRTERGPDGRPRYICDMDETDVITPRAQTMFQFSNESSQSLTNSTITSFNPLPFFPTSVQSRQNGSTEKALASLLPPVEITPSASASKSSYSNSLETHYSISNQGHAGYPSNGSRRDHSHRVRSASDSNADICSHRFTPYPSLSLSIPISPRNAEAQSSSNDSQTFFWPSPQTTLMPSQMQVSDDVFYPTPPSTAQSNTISMTNSMELTPESIISARQSSQSTVGKDIYDPWSCFPFNISTKSNESVERASYSTTDAPSQADSHLQTPWLWG